ncbi:MAG TPA: ABC transporter ATP-binding protein [Acidimicrobiales bacterium]|nr:ABC transporter ATP-binding protein [Acidimicrobiales bacterium]
MRALWTVTRLAFRADRAAAIAATLLSLVSGVFGTLSTVAFARAVQAVVAGDPQAGLGAVIALVVLGRLSFTASMVMLDLRFRLVELVGELVESELIDAMTGFTGLELHERPVHLDRLEVLRKQVGNLSNSIGALMHNVSLWTGLASTVGVLVSVHPLLLVLPIAGIPALVVTARGTTRFEQALDDSSEQLRRADHLYLLATAAGPGKELRTFGLGREVVARHARFLREGYDAVSRVQLRWGALAGVAWATQGLAQIGAIAFAAMLAIDGRASVGDVVLVATLVGALEGHLQELLGMVTWLFNTLRAAERYAAVVDAATTASDELPLEPAPVPAALQRGIELDGVSFRYPDTESETLRDVSLLLPAGATVAVVGENGAGKSTLVKLLGRFYEPTSGVIRVDGVDLRRFDAAAWRGRLSGAFQDHARFELIAREVVGVGDLERIDDEPSVVVALGRAGCGELPERLEDGLGTRLGRSFDDGIEPSGGQWQQLALGRALLRDQPLLLLLDEPTSALDPDAEHALFEGYAAAAREAARTSGAITLLVSHRFSTVRMADLIVVMEDGKVSQVGSHDELMAAGGLYAELFTMQARAYR